MKTLNPALPHPDDEREPEPMPLYAAIIWATRVLRDPHANQWTRNKVADELLFALESQQDAEK